MGCWHRKILSEQGRIHLLPCCPFHTPRLFGHLCWTLISVADEYDRVTSTLELTRFIMITARLHQWTLLAPVNLFRHSKKTTREQQIL
jgi:hypothetical protein